MNKAPLAPAITKAEEKIYADVYDVLMVGMVVSNILFAVALVLALIHPHFVPLTRGYVLGSYHWKAIKQGIVSFRPMTVMMVATLLLILTPVSRVMISIYAFYAGGDHKYVIVTGIVFAVIVLTVLLGFFGLR